MLSKFDNIFLQVISSKISPFARLNHVLRMHLLNVICPKDWFLKLKIHQTFAIPYCACNVLCNLN